MACEKKRFRGKRQARRATSGAAWRIHVYWCEECRAWHVSNGEKSAHFEWRGDDTWQDRRRTRRTRQKEDMMPAKSKSQRRLIAAAEHGADFPKARAIRKSMSPQSMHDFASSKEKGLPERVGKKR